MKKAVFGGVFLLALATRLAYRDVIWVEEGYPLAAAREMLRGSVLYRDLWFDKPPLFPLTYLLWGAADGWPLRLAGALFVLLSAWGLYRAGRALWGEREGLYAAAFTGFFLVFDFHPATLALTPDLLLIPLGAGAVAAAAAGQPVLAGVLAGASTHFNSKGLLIAAVCLPWIWRRAGRFGIGFVSSLLAVLGWLLSQGALAGYWQQVWVWGAAYSRDTYLSAPVIEGLRKSLSWSWFHLTLVVAAGWYWWRERDAAARRLAFWCVLALAGAWMGLRFFPRYWFLLLPPLALAAARGIRLSRRWVALALLLPSVIPLARFGPRYVQTALGEPWADLAMWEDSKSAAAWLRAHARPGDTLFVWGYRPDLIAAAGLPLGAPFLDSQPLNGVFADRHLWSTKASVASRARLDSYRPTYAVDGLGPYNARLALPTEFLARYERVAATAGTVIYRRRE